MDLRPHLTLMLVVIVLGCSWLADGVNIRLANGNGTCSGRVEVYYNGQWGTVCDDKWDMKDGAVVCRQVGCGTALSIHSSAHFGQGSGPIHLDDVECSGSESSITACHRAEKHNCNHGEDAGVTCADNIRLVRGRGRCDGRVEINHNGQWGTVCDDGWGSDDAEVACSQMGCGRATRFYDKAHFGQGSGPIFLDDVGCSGNEITLTSCSHGGLGKHNCGHDEDAGVVCSDVLQSPMLVPSHSAILPGESVEFKCNLTRQNFMSLNFRLYKNGGLIKTQTSQSPATFTLTQDVSDQTQYSCDYSYRSISITSSRSSTAGITVVTLPTPHIYLSTTKEEVTWGERVDITCSLNTQFTGGNFKLTQRSGSVRETNSGTSVTFSFTKVDFVDEGSYYCQYQTQVSGRDFSSPQSSSVGFTIIVPLHTPHISLNPSKEVTWGERVDITCSVETQFTGGNFTLTHSSGSLRETKSGTSVTFSLLNVDFVHEGSYYCQYKTRVSSRDFNSPQSRTVKFLVVVNLLQPNITLSAPNGGSYWGPEGLEVTRGYSFSIICFTQPQYTGGFFHLEFSGFNITRTTRPSVNHSATFSFPEADYDDQGNYSCVYEVTVSSRTFTSSSTELLGITVKASLAPFIGSGVGIGLLLILVPIIIFFIWRCKKQKMQMDVKMVYKQHSSGPGNTYDIGHGKNETDEDDEDYENADSFQNREDSDDSGEDYINIDEKKSVDNDYSGNETEDDDDGDDYENVDFPGEDRVNTHAVAEKSWVDSDFQDEDIYANV